VVQEEDASSVDDVDSSTGNDEETDTEEDNALNEDGEDSESDKSDNLSVNQLPLNEDPVGQLRSHDGCELWKTQPVCPDGSKSRPQNILRSSSGPTKNVAERSFTIEGSFRCFITDEICDLIVRHTNSEGERQLAAQCKAITPE
jgi:hypothetical protein